MEFSLALLVSLAFVGFMVNMVEWGMKESSRLIKIKKTSGKWKYSK